MQRRQKNQKDNKNGRIRKDGRHWHNNRDITWQTMLLLDTTSFKATKLESAMKQDTTAYPPQLLLFTVRDHHLKALTLPLDSVCTSHASAIQPKEEKGDVRTLWTGKLRGSRASRVGTVLTQSNGGRILEIGTKSLFLRSAVSDSDLTTA